MSKQDKKPAQNDPLEASKILAKPPPPPPPPAPEPVKEFKPDPAGKPDVHPASAARKYRVRNTTTISLSGQITRLNEGDIVSESSYGPEQMARILESGVPLELL